MDNANPKTKKKLGALATFWAIIPIILVVILYLSNVMSLFSALVLLLLWVIVVRSNAEIFLIAFIMAMIIRCFSIEVYKIPTGSMEPTLHGDMRDGDRVIADKITFLIQPIKRYDVLLFRFPLDKTTNFIKRVVGLPSEEIMIKHGDIYVRPFKNGKEDEGGDFAIAKKPLGKQESIWMPVWPETGKGSKWNGDEDYLRDNWNLPKDNQYRIENGKLYLQGNTVIKYQHEIRDWYPWNDGNHNVTDLKLAFRFIAEESGGEIQTTLKTQSGNITVRLFPAKANPPDSESPNLTWHFRFPSSDLMSWPNTFEFNVPEQNVFISQKIDVSIEPGKEYLVELLNFDGSFYFKLNKKVVLKYDYITDLKNAYTDANVADEPISIEAKKHPVVLSDFYIGRDVYYACDYDSRGVLKEGKPFSIPAGKYFAIGDNVPNSKDSRAWRVRTVTLKNGKVIKADVDSVVDDGDEIRIVRERSKNRGGDIWGVSHVIKKSDIDYDNYDVEPYPFVSEDEIFGRGLFIYWPIKRVKLIR